MGVASPGILLASFEPNIVMILEPASLRLFTASDISATEFETVAIKILAPAKKKFVTMPISAVLSSFFRVCRL